MAKGEPFIILVKWKDPGAGSSAMAQMRDWMAKGSLFIHRPPSEGRTTKEEFCGMLVLQAGGGLGAFLMGGDPSDSGIMDGKRNAFLVDDATSLVPWIASDGAEYLVSYCSRCASEGVCPEIVLGLPVTKSLSERDIEAMRGKLERAAYGRGIKVHWIDSDDMQRSEEACELARDVNAACAGEEGFMPISPEDARRALLDARSASSKDPWKDAFDMLAGEPGKKRVPPAIGRIPSRECIRSLMDGDWEWLEAIDRADGYNRAYKTVRVIAGEGMDGKLHGFDVDPKVWRRLSLLSCDMFYANRGIPQTGRNLPMGYKDYAVLSGMSALLAFAEAKRDTSHR